MAKKRKPGSASTAVNGDGAQKQLPIQNNNGSDSDSSSSDDDSLVLEGTLIRNPNASDSSDDEEGMSSESDGEGPAHTNKKAKNGDDIKASAKSKGGMDKGTNVAQNRTSQQRQQQQQRAKKKNEKSINNNEPETIQVEFLFCDMHERFFHGMKTLLHRHAVHAPHSSPLADLVIENEMVGTVLSSDLDPRDSGDNSGGDGKKKNASAAPSMTSSAGSPPEEANVFGFASIVNVTTNHSSPSIQSLKATCLKHCPSQHKAELETVLSGKTKRPAGFFFHERMVNVPLEIVEVLHQQLVLDMDHAVAKADGEAERKSLDFGAFIRLAPCYQCSGGGGDVVYKYFDDEVFATNAEFTYDFVVPRSSNFDGDDADEEKMACSVIVMTKTGHRDAMKELKKMIHVG